MMSVAHQDDSRPRPEPSPWLTAAEAAAYARVSVRTIYLEIRCRRLRAAIVGGRRSYRTRREWLDSWLVESSTPQEIAR
jgi:excisionase family DNA binding protein